MHSVGSSTNPVCTHRCDFLKPRILFFLVLKLLTQRLQQHSPRVSMDGTRPRANSQSNLNCHAAHILRLFTTMSSSNTAQRPHLHQFTVLYRPDGRRRQCCSCRHATRRFSDPLVLRLQVLDLRSHTLHLQRWQPSSVILSTSDHRIDVTALHGMEYVCAPKACHDRVVAGTLTGS